MALLRNLINYIFPVPERTLPTLQSLGYSEHAGESRICPVVNN